MSYESDTESPDFLRKYPKSTTPWALKNFQLLSQDLKDAGPSGSQVGINLNGDQSKNLKSDNCHLQCYFCEKTFTSSKGLNIHRTRLHSCLPLIVLGVPLREVTGYISETNKLTALGKKYF